MMKAIETSQLTAITGGFSKMDRSNYAIGKLVALAQHLPLKKAQYNGMLWIESGREFGRALPAPLISSVEQVAKWKKANGL